MDQNKIVKDEIEKIVKNIVNGLDKNSVKDDDLKKLFIDGQLGSGDSEDDKETREFLKSFLTSCYDFLKLLEDQTKDMKMSDIDPKIEELLKGDLAVKDIFVKLPKSI